MKATRDAKGKEYCHDASRFANFDRLATDLKMDHKKILWVFYTKHHDSIVSYLQNDGKIFSNESIHGRIRDAMVYLSLLDGMIFEEECGKDDVKQGPWLA